MISKTINNQHALATKNVKKLKKKKKKKKLEGLVT